MVQLPLEGEDGWYRLDDRCVICGKSILNDPKRLRMFVGRSSSEGTVEDGVSFDIFSYGVDLPGRSNNGLYGIHILPENNDPEAVIEFCSVGCLKDLFAAIVDSFT
jgi:hypothetical protein